MLEHQQQTTSLSVKEEKVILEQIKKLSANKPLIRQYDEAKESFEGVKEHHATLYAQLKTKSTELSGLNEVEDKAKEKLEVARGSRSRPSRSAWARARRAASSSSSAPSSTSTSSSPSRSSR